MKPPRFKNLDSYEKHKKYCYEWRKANLEKHRQYQRNCVNRRARFFPGLLLGFGR